MIDNSTIRAIAVHALRPSDAKRAADAVASALQLGLGETVVFCPSGTALDGAPEDIEKVEFPLSADSSPKQKNFIIEWFKEHGFRGFLHIMETSTKANTSTKSYMDKLESTMSALDYDIHFSTATDRCNYVFNKFCPRLSLDVDDEALKQKAGLPGKICFTSHSNASYVTFNFNALGDDVPKFDERFTIGMFFIIEFLARRRATKRDDQLYYMNQYLSIGDEVGGYDILEEAPRDDDSSKMQQENEVFRSLGIDYTPDNNIDIVLDTLYTKLKRRMA